jgi:hypothetical protein
MRIKRFTEQQESVEISTDRVEEILQELKSVITQLSKSKELSTSLSNELSNFRSGSRTANNQIDDSALNLDLAASKLEEASSVIDEVIKSLEDYNEKGPRYLYG